MIFSSEKISDKFLEINHCGILNMKTRDCLTLRENGRVDYYVMYVLRGLCTVVENGTEIKAGAGDLIVYHPHERQEYYFRGEDRTVYAYAHFSGTICQSLLGELGFCHRVTHVGWSPQLERLFRETVNEHYLRKPFWETTVASLLLQFLTTAARNLSLASSKWTPSLDPIIQHMHVHCEQNHPVSFYADMCHLSESRFAHLFKQATGMAPKQYLLKIKTETACRLLLSTSLSVTEIALAVGIDDINYFGRLVKKQTGKTPSQWR